MPRRPSCMVCSRREAVALYLDERGWYLLGCSDKRCVAPLGCIPFDYVMDYADFVACRRMIADNRRKAMSGEDGGSYGTMYLGSAVKP